MRRRPWQREPRSSPWYRRDDVSLGDDEVLQRPLAGRTRRAQDHRNGGRQPRHSAAPIVLGTGSALGRDGQGGDGSRRELPARLHGDHEAQ